MITAEATHGFGPEKSPELPSFRNVELGMLANRGVAREKDSRLSPQLLTRSIRRLATGRLKAWRTLDRDTIKDFSTCFPQPIPR